MRSLAPALALALAAVSVTAYPKLEARQATTCPEIDSVSLANALFTAVPSSILSLAFSNSAALTSAIYSEFATGTPTWYSSLPADVQAFLTCSTSSSVITSRPTSSKDDKNDKNKSTSKDDGELSSSTIITTVFEIPTSLFDNPSDVLEAESNRDYNNDNNDDGGLSSGAKAGIGVGVTLGVLGIAGALAAFFFYRKKKHGGDAGTGAADAGVAAGAAGAAGAAAAKSPDATDAPTTPAAGHSPYQGAPVAPSQYTANSVGSTPAMAGGTFFGQQAKDPNSGVAAPYAPPPAYGQAPPPPPAEMPAAPAPQMSQPVPNAQYPQQTGPAELQ